MLRIDKDTQVESDGPRTDRVRLNVDDMSLSTMALVPETLMEVLTYQVISVLIYVHL